MSKPEPYEYRFTASFISLHERDIHTTIEFFVRNGESILNKAWLTASEHGIYIFDYSIRDIQFNDPSKEMML